MLKISLLFKKFTNFTLQNSYKEECEMFRVLFLYEHKQKLNKRLTKAGTVFEKELNERECLEQLGIIIVNTRLFL